MSVKKTMEKDKSRYRHAYISYCFSRILRSCINPIPLLPLNCRHRQSYHRTKQNVGRKRSTFRVGAKKRSVSPHLLTKDAPVIPQMVISPLT